MLLRDRVSPRAQSGDPAEGGGDTLAMKTAVEIKPRPRRFRVWCCLVAVVLLVFLGLNAMAFMQARALTHYRAEGARTRAGAELSLAEKARILCFGPTVRRPRNVYTPARFAMPWTTHTFPGAHGLQLEAWRVPGGEGRPVVLLFHGYGASKDSLLRAAKEFHSLGCEAWLVDFHGSGGSAGSETTIGYDEAEDVAAAVHHALSLRGGKGPVVLYGTSMGAAAILCAVHRSLVQPDALILECPFDRLVTTVGNRFAQLGLPRFPLAHLLVFWGGVQAGFDGLGHNPIDYARSVRCPTLLLQGERDEYVGLAPGKALAAALGKHGTFKLFPDKGHAFLAYSAADEWRKTVRKFLQHCAPVSHNKSRRQPRSGGELSSRG